MTSKPVTVPALPQRPTVKLTVVRLKVPFWKRLFASELVLGIMGTVTDVALLSREEAQTLLQAGHESRWLPYQSHPGTEPGPLAAPSIQPKGTP